MKLPAQKKEYPKTGKENNTSINVFRYEDETTYCIYIQKQHLKSMLICYNYQILKITCFN